MLASGESHYRRQVVEAVVSESAAELVESEIVLAGPGAAVVALAVDASVVDLGSAVARHC